MSIVSANQSFSASASGIAIQNLFSKWEAAMDTNLLGFGRNVTLHLKPAKQACPDVNCSFNSFYKRYMGTNNKVCETCKGQGFLIEPRQSIYIANIRWTDEPFNESTRNIEEQHVVGRMGANFARTKMNFGATSHIREAIGATIDGIDVELFDEPRFTGFGGRVKYVVAVWKVVNR